MAGDGARGLFVVFEGGDSVGKSTQVTFLVEWLRDRGHEVVVTFEPGDTRVGRQVRDLVLDPATGDVAPRAEALLYAADKAQHVHEVVAPALARGAIVVSDRYVDSMIAYQGAGRVLDAGEVARLGEWATAGLTPDLTVVLDVDPDRAVAHKADKDRLESESADFHARVRQHFLALAAAAPERYLVLAGRGSREEIATAVRQRLVPLLDRLSDAGGTLQR